MILVWAFMSFCLIERLFLLNHFQCCNAHPSKTDWPDRIPFRPGNAVSVDAARYFKPLAIILQNRCTEMVQNRLADRERRFTCDSCSRALRAEPQIHLLGT